jgi:hypothetical protein
VLGHSAGAMAICVHMSYPVSAVTREKMLMIRWSIHPSDHSSYHVRRGNADKYSAQDASRHRSDGHSNREDETRMLVQKLRNWDAQTSLVSGY